MPGNPGFFDGLFLIGLLTIVWWTRHRRQVEGSFVDLPHQDEVTKGIIFLSSIFLCVRMNNEMNLKRKRIVSLNRLPVLLLWSTEECLSQNIFVVFSLKVDVPIGGDHTWKALPWRPHTYTHGMISNSHPVIQYSTFCLGRWRWSSYRQGGTFGYRQGV